METVRSTKGGNEAVPLKLVGLFDHVCGKLLDLLSQVPFPTLKEPNKYSPLDSPPHGRIEACTLEKLTQEALALEGKPHARTSHGVERWYPM